MIAAGEGRGPWMQTFTGRAWHFLTPRADDVDVRDVAHALGMLCRYGGHSRHFYSVAEHSVLVSRLVRPEHALQGLLHDATEAYIVDVPRPLKHVLEGYKPMEAAHWRVIAERFGVPEELSDDVKRVDNAMLFVEKPQVLGPCSPWMEREWGMGAEPDPSMSRVELEFLSPEEAEKSFLRRFHELTAQR